MSLQNHQFEAIFLQEHKQVDRLPQRHLGRHVSHGCSQDFTAVMLHSLDSHLEQNRLEHFSPLFYQAGVIQPKFQTTILIS